MPWLFAYGINRFSHDVAHMKFQDSSTQGLKVTGGRKKCEECTNTYGQAKSNMPHQLLESWGHNNFPLNLDPLKNISL